MVATIPAQVRPMDTRPLPSPGLPDASPNTPESQNRVFRVLMRRLNLSQTFGENMIFMLNRASSASSSLDQLGRFLTNRCSDRSMEDRCMQVLVLKLLYVLFTTPGTTEYFYTNDLCVIVDVFLRELLDLDEEAESVGIQFSCIPHIDLIQAPIVAAHLPPRPAPAPYQNSIAHIPL